MRTIRAAQQQILACHKGSANMKIGEWRLSVSQKGKRKGTETQSLWGAIKCMTTDTHEVPERREKDR